MSRISFQPLVVVFNGLLRLLLSGRPFDNLINLFGSAPFVAQEFRPCMFDFKGTKYEQYRMCHYKRQIIFILINVRSTREFEINWLKFFSSYNYLSILSIVEQELIGKE